MRARRPYALAALSRKLRATLAALLGAPGMDAGCPIKKPVAMPWTLVRDNGLG
jgi:hypothetical protein